MIHRLKDKASIKHKYPPIIYAYCIKSFVDIYHIDLFFIRSSVYTVINLQVESMQLLFLTALVFNEILIGHIPVMGML